MAWQQTTTTPDAEAVAASVLKAFRAARAAGRPPVMCYRAGVEAWRRAHPDQSAEYAAKRAVAVIIEKHVKFRVEE